MASSMKQTILKFLISSIALICFVNTVSATTVVMPTDDEMIIAARAIIRARVLSVGTSYDEQQDRIYTYTTLRVQEVLKGQINERRIVIKEEGGNLGDRGSIVFGTPRYTPGEKVLVYLNTWTDGSLRTHQMFLGKFLILTDPHTGKQVVVRSLPDGEVKVLDEYPNLLTNQREGVVTDRMELKAYKRLIQSRVEANLERIQSYEDNYYSNAPMFARPPEYDQVSGRGDIQPNYTFITNPPVRWFEPDSGQPVIFSVNPDGAPASGLSDLDASMNAWSTVPGCSLVVQRDPQVTGACGPTFTLNSIIFNGCDGRWGAGPGCSGILAVGGLSWGSETKVINGVTFRRARGGFVSFNPWCPNSPCGVQGDVTTQLVATHELGHALGLGHSWQPSFGGSPTATQQQATMFYLAQFNRCAALAADDIAGITFIYPSGSGGGGALTITTSSLPNGSLGSLYTQLLSASGGTQPYTWSLVGGALPGGLSLNPNGTISGTPTATGTFNFTVQVNDASSSMTQKGLSITVGASGTQYNSDFLSQTVPSTVQAGQSFSITLSWQNNGTQVWNGSSGFRLGSQNPPNNTTWGGDRVNLPGFVVNPGQTLNLTFTAFAPSTPGTYNFQWQTYQEGMGFFGEPSTNVAIQVTGSGGGGTNDASFVSQNVSTSMTTGQSKAVSVTMQNTGTTTWSAGTYKLGSQNPTDNVTWGLNRVNLTSDIAPGGLATFSFTIVAPATAGTYNFQWRMLQEGVGYFGAASSNAVINVTQSGGGGGGGSGPYNAAFVSQIVPSVMNPGQNYSISLTMRNTGTTSWATSSGISLASQNPAGNLTWNISQVNLNKFVPVGSQFSFSFVVRAPSTPGNYNFQWQLKNSSGYFGSMSTNLVIQVGSGSGGTNNASFVSQSVSAAMTTGQSASVSVTMQNTGTTTWSAGTYKLGSQNPTDNLTWGLNRVNLASNVAPGGQATFSFTIVAPATAGTYNFQWRMLQEGVGYFGGSSTGIVINVTQSGGAGGTNNAAFVSQTVPTSMNAGQSANVSVVMQNTGTTTWSAGTYKLGSQNPTDSLTWGLNRVNLASNVAPGGQATFSFTIVAPATAGTYNFQWRMLQEGVGYFGAASSNVAVSVTVSSSPLVITTSSIPNGLKGQNYSAQVNASGGAQPYTWSMTGAPSGLTINASGAISGKPTASGTYNIQVTVKDANSTSIKKTYKILVK